MTGVSYPSILFHRDPGFHLATDTCGYADQRRQVSGEKRIDLFAMNRVIVANKAREFANKARAQLSRYNVLPCKLQ